MIYKEKYVSKNKNKKFKVFLNFRCIISHEAPYTGGFGAELAACIQVQEGSTLTYTVYLNKNKNHVI